MADFYQAINFGTVVGDAPVDAAVLKRFSDLLHASAMPHRIAEEKGCLQLWVYKQEHVDPVKHLYQRFCEGEFDQLQIRRSAVSHGEGFQLSRVLALPVTLIFSVLSLLGFAVVSLQLWPLISIFSFQGLVVENGQWLLNSTVQSWDLLMQGQLWRLVTPIFLHFGLMHIAFNVVLFIYFAKQIEQREGALSLLSHCLLLALLSNTFQFLVAGDHLFGGLSGVVYGLMAYCWFINFLLGKMAFQVPQGLLFVAVLMIALGFLEVFSILGMSLANWAHLGGLLGGLLLALLRHSWR